MSARDDAQAALFRAIADLAMSSSADGVLKLAQAFALTSDDESDESEETFISTGGTQMLPFVEEPYYEDRAQVVGFGFSGFSNR